MRWLRGEVLKFAILLMVAIGAGPTTAAFWQWSTTAATNATADPTINWAEGMSPSSVNDSARAMMAATAQWRNDIRGLTATTGTGSAYVLASNQGGFVASSTGNGFMIGFFASATNTVGPTINVDGAGAKPLRRATGANLEAGVIVSGSPYTAVYRNATDEWLLINMRGLGPGEVPIGAVLDWTAGGVPNSNYIAPEGQCISQTTYAAYFALVAFTYGGGCGPGLFQVPDYRGRVLAHNDNGAGRLPCSLLGCGTAAVSLTTNELPSHTHSFAGTTDPGGPSPHTHNWLAPTSRSVNINNGGGGATNNLWQGATGEATNTENSSLNHQHNFNGTTGSAGSGASFNIIQPTSVTFKILRIL